MKRSTKLRARVQGPSQPCPAGPGRSALSPRGPEAGRRARAGPPDAGQAIIWTLNSQLGPERHGGRVPAGLWARVVQRLLALNAVIWHNWATGAPVKRSLIAYDH
jgi:hypothetical protein